MPEGQDHLQVVKTYRSQRDFTQGVLAMAAEGWHVASVNHERHPSGAMLLLSFGLAEILWKPRIVVTFGKYSNESGHARLSSHLLATAGGTMRIPTPVLRPARLIEAAQAFIQVEAYGGIVLVVAALVALGWVNSPWGES